MSSRTAAIGRRDGRCWPYRGGVSSTVVVGQITGPAGEAPGSSPPLRLCRPTPGAGLLRGARRPPAAWGSRPT